MVYYGGSIATFRLEDDGAGGTDLTLEDAGVPLEHRAEVTAGWVSVLLALKAAVDYGAPLLPQPGALVGAGVRGELSRARASHLTLPVADHLEPRASPSAADPARRA